MYKIPVYLTLMDGQCYNAVPVNIRINEARKECLQILLEAGGEPFDIPLSELAEMKAVTANAHFSCITFG